jgi:hypothetical protein
MRWRVRGCRTVRWRGWGNPPHPHPAGIAHAIEHTVGTVAARMLPLLVAVGMLVALAVLAQLGSRSRRARDGRLFRLRLGEELDRLGLAEVLVGVARSVGRGGLARPWLGFELHACGGEVVPYLFCSGGVSATLLESLISDGLPGAKLIPAEGEQTREARSRVRRTVSLGIAGCMTEALRYELQTDPSRWLLRALAECGDEERAVVQVLFAAAPGRATGRMFADARRIREGKRRRPRLAWLVALPWLALVWLVELFQSQPAGGQPRPVYQPSPWEVERAKALERKASERLFCCSLRLSVSTSGWGRARRWLGELRSAYGVYDHHGRLRSALEPWGTRRLERRLLPLRSRLLLSASELAAICPLSERPAEAPVALEEAPARELAPAAAAPRSGIVLGESDARGRTQPVFVDERSLLAHLHVIAATWAGKSTLLLNIACQAIARGLGLIVLEPKGDLIDQIVARVPRERASDVILVDFSDPEYPPAFNLLAGGPGQGEALAAILSRLYSGNWGPRSDDLLRAAVLTLEGGADGAVPTLADVLPLLTDPRRRTRYEVKDRVVLEGFWQTWERLSEGQRQQAIAPLANKLRAFLLREPVRDALVQPEAPDLREVIGHGGVVLCKLSTDALSDEAAALFGSVLVHRVWQVAQSLGPSGERKPVLCLLDEAHRFTSIRGGIGEMLSQARGYGLGVVLAHQQLSQLSVELREAIQVNCRSKVCFQLDPPDNERMAHHFQPRLDASDLLHLDRFQLAARIFHDGKVLPPITATAKPAPEIEDERMLELIRARTQLAGRTKLQVEQLIAKRFPELERPARGQVAADQTSTAEDETGTQGGTSGGTPDVPPEAPRPPHSDGDRADPEKPDRISPDDDRDDHSPGRPGQAA